MAPDPCGRPKLHLNIKPTKLAQSSDTAREMKLDYTINSLLDLLQIPDGLGFSAQKNSDGFDRVLSWKPSTKK